MSKSKGDLASLKSWCKYNFDYEVKGHTDVMNVRETCAMVIHSRAKQSMTLLKDKKAEARIQSHVINPKFDIEVKSQRRIMGNRTSRPADHSARVSGLLGPCDRTTRTVSLKLGSDVH